MFQKNKPFIIGETAYNHQGDYDYLKRMVTEIGEIPLEAVKFHLLFDIESYIQKDHPLTNSIKNWIFLPGQWEAIFNHATKNNLKIIALCDDVASLDFVLPRSDIYALEIHSSSLGDYYLLKEAVKFKGIIILGIGGSTLDEILDTVTFFKKHSRERLLLMYGFQHYPTDPKEIKLFRMKKFHELLELPMGYADHTSFDHPDNIWLSSLGAAMGFNILEKHFTPDPGIHRIDYQSAIGKSSMCQIKQMMSLALEASGGGNLAMSITEREYGNTGPMKKAIVAKDFIPAGSKLTLENMCFKRTQEKSTLKQNQFIQLLGVYTTQDIGADEIIDFSKIHYQSCSSPQNNG